MTRMSRASAIGTALIVVAALLGCAPESSSSPSPGGVTSGGGPLSGDITVYAAASLQAAFDDLTGAFSAIHPEVAFSPTVTDGSSTLVTQLKAGAQADLFASADEVTMQAAVDADLVAGEPELFATNELVIAVTAGNPLGITSLADLAAPSAGGDAPITVMCAAEVPCGAAAHALLDAAGLELSPASEEQNVSATLAKVVNGEADAGLVYRTDVRSASCDTDVLSASDEVEAVTIEGAAERPNRYPIAVLRESSSSDAARAFIEFVRSASGQEILAGYGFGAL